MTNFNELYYVKPYDTTFSARVVSCEKKDDLYRVILDQTLFYPEGGGQPADHGFLNGLEVLDVQEEEEKVVHYLREPLDIGTDVEGKIDWERRFDFMQNHSGEHIVSGLIHRHFGYENVGFHMGEVITIDFDGPLTDEQVRMIETEANAVVTSNIEVKSVFPTQAELDTTDYRSKKQLTGTVRLIVIDNADCCACCGTHVRRTGEIGLIKLLSCKKHKKGVRIEMVSGKRALLYTQKIFEQNNLISVALSAEPFRTSEALTILQRQLLDSNRRITELTEIFFDQKLASFEEDQPLLIDFEEGIDRAAMRRMANDMIAKKNPVTAVVLAKDNEGYAFVILSKQKDLSGFKNELIEKLNGRGGGNKEMLQGTFASDPETIESVLKELFC